MRMQAFNQQSLEFQEKLVARGGLGEETYLPPGWLARCYLAAWQHLS